MSGTRSKSIARLVDGIDHHRMTKPVRNWFATLTLSGTRQQRYRQAKRAWVQRRRTQAVIANGEQPV